MPYAACPVHPWLENLVMRKQLSLGDVLVKSCRGREKIITESGAGGAPVSREVGLNWGAVLWPIGSHINLLCGAERGEVAGNIQGGQGHAAVGKERRRVDELLVRLQRKSSGDKQMSISHEIHQTR